MALSSLFMCEEETSSPTKKLLQIKDFSKECGFDWRYHDKEQQAPVKYRLKGQELPFFSLGPTDASILASDALQTFY